MRQIVLIGANYGNAGAIGGAEIGAIQLKNNLVNRFNLIDGGLLPDLSSSRKHGEECISEFNTISHLLRDKVFENLQNGCRILTIGGDHSIAFGTIWGTSLFAKQNNLKFGVIYMDAHGDINTFDTSVTKHIHGMPVSYAIGIENRGFTDLHSNCLFYQNLLYIGTRSLDLSEEQYIKSSDIKVLSSDYINNSSWKDTIAQIKQFVESRQLQIIHLSVDIDTVDPQSAPGTGVPEKDGISTEIFQNIINNILENVNVYSVDFVEYNPLLDTNYKTYEISLQTCEMIIDHLCCK